MRSWLTLAALLAFPLGGGAAAQVLDDAMVPRGRVRIQASPVYWSWDSRFGRDADGVTGREALGEDLTSESAETLFPGTDSLIAAIESMSGSTGYTPVLGAAIGRVTKEITRVEFAAHIGIFDWLTIGAMLPWARTRSNVDVYFTPDTLTGDLGVNPVATAGGEVQAFLASLEAAGSAAQTNASQVCAGAPGSAECTAAQSLADRTAAFSASASTAYSASPFYPIAGSATATALDAAVADLDAELVAAGLAGIAAPMAFASSWVGPDEFTQLSNTAGLGVEGSPLTDTQSLWGAGDMEVTASVRILEGAVRDSAEAPPSLAYRMFGTLLVRLPTGLIDHPDVFLDVGTGDGQTDFEGRLYADMVAGRFGLRAGGRYGIQLPRTLVRRVAPPEQILAPVWTRHTVEWDPGSYFGAEVAPSFHISPELSIGAEYWVFRKYRDHYTLTGASAGAPVNTYVMEVESGMTVHYVGGVLRYDTVARRMETGSTIPLQLHLRVQRAIAGGGGQTPVTTRLELGLRIFRRFWGAP